MKRTIKFRGKRADNGEWIYGYLADDDYINNVNEIAMPSEEVASSTVGQFTGLTDCNGKEIYEGDYARYEHRTQDGRLEIGNSYEIQWNERDCAFCAWDGFTHISLPPFGSFRVIGNIHDNPELTNQPTVI